MLNAQHVNLSSNWVVTDNLKSLSTMGRRLLAGPQIHNACPTDVHDLYTAGVVLPEASLIVEYRGDYLFFLGYSMRSRQFFEYTYNLPLPCSDCLLVPVGSQLAVILADLNYNAYSTLWETELKTILIMFFSPEGYIDGTLQVDCQHFIPALRFDVVAPLVMGNLLVIKPKPAAMAVVLNLNSLKFTHILHPYRMCYLDRTYAGFLNSHSYPLTLQLFRLADLPSFLDTYGSSFFWKGSSETYRLTSPDGIDLQKLVYDFWGFLGPATDGACVAQVDRSGSASLVLLRDDEQKAILAYQLGGEQCTA